MVLFWSIADTKISRLAKRALFHRILALDKMRFYTGNLLVSKTRPKNLAQRFITDLNKLGKVLKQVNDDRKIGRRSHMRGS